MENRSGYPGAFVSQETRQRWHGRSGRSGVRLNRGESPGPRTGPRPRQGEGLHPAQGSRMDSKKNRKRRRGGGRAHTERHSDLDRDRDSAQRKVGRRRRTSGCH
ncbi:hypothetical protein K466DRAFT_226885 [Polyporus arcularius HHB13444]|uniref:Uncharacterized protein n=1 Tax=Polyporus arcularius HHB13444 TaxID=1314778 RepID=A0A5C3P827_9APHY|nr:hypothetical protein K466DRAFT_226885 [Polyporus arcularius HHB13444]